MSMSESKQQRIIIIGGGIAAIEAATQLSKRGYPVAIIEKQAQLGGHLLDWDRLFPFKRHADEVLGALLEAMPDDVQVLTDQHINRIDKLNDQFIITLSDGNSHTAHAVLIATGFKLFDAHRKEEYGYGIYDNVYTSADLERMFRNPDGVKLRNGETPRRIGFIHCVGSRDEKIGNRYCSKVCCVTAVKQASEMKELYPDAEVFCFYMDLRMFDRHYEQTYLDAQKKYGVTFIRGRLSEASEDINKRIVMKVEDTLAGRPMKITIDMLVLMAGMEAPSTSLHTIQTLGLSIGKDKFLTANDEYIGNNASRTPGVFMAGTCTGPKNIPEVIADADASVIQILNYLQDKA